MQLELLALREKGGPLAALSEQEILDLAAGAKELHCTPGHIVMEAGEVGDHGCLVLQDRLVAGWLLIIVDNIVHILINGLAIRHIG